MWEADDDTRAGSQQRYVMVIGYENTRIGAVGRAIQLDRHGVPRGGAGQLNDCVFCRQVTEDVKNKRTCCAGSGHHRYTLYFSYIAAGSILITHSEIRSRDRVCS